MTLIKQHRCSLTLLALMAGASTHLCAQTANTAGADPKTVAIDAVPADTALAQWVNTVVVATPPVASIEITTLPLRSSNLAALAARYEPWPVILSAPELPLLGASARAAGRQWGASFNYQGMHVRLLTLDAAGRAVAARPLSAAPQPGERFKLRVTATFDALAEIDLVLGTPFDGRQVGQLYPTPGYSVQMRAGETVDLPMEANQYFMFGSDANQRLLLQVRHSAVTDNIRSQQPAYRQDGAMGSNYLQLVPRGTLPSFEQLVTVATR